MAGQHTHVGAAQQGVAEHSGHAERRGIFPYVAIGGAVVALTIVAMTMRPRKPGLREKVELAAQAAVRSTLTLDEIPFDGRRALGYLEQICALGPRPSGSAGMASQQNLVEKFFQERGAEVRRQTFEVRHPRDGSKVEMANLIAVWHPERKRRLLLCAHYDTRPRPDRDRRNPEGTFIGANDGASGVALLMELASHMPDLAGPFGVDFVLFDGEEFVWDDDRDEYFLGSTWFARRYVAEPRDYQYDWGILLDMVGDKELGLRQDWQSMEWRDTRPLVLQVWNTAKRLGVREFIFRRGTPIRDDHIPLHDIAGLRVCDVIDFEYPHWHTTQDVPENCSAESLAKVGWVVLEWLKSVQGQQVEP